jgi:hypothetical protein
VAKVAPGNYQSSGSARRRSVVEEEDGLLERRSSSWWLASSRGLGHREAAMRTHEGGARWPALGAWSRGGQREVEWSGERVRRQL